MRRYTDNCKQRIKSLTSAHTLEQYEWACIEGNSINGEPIPYQIQVLVDQTTRGCLPKKLHSPRY